MSFVGENIPLQSGKKDGQAIFLSVAEKEATKKKRPLYDKRARGGESPG